MSDDVLQTLIICATVLIVIGGLGIGVMLYCWRDRDGSMSLKARENSLKAERLASEFKKLEGPK